MRVLDDLDIGEDYQAFADHLAIKSNQLVVRAAHAELPIIAKAKRFIREHYTENLSLSQVSRVVNSSHFYFCKQFRKATGLSFTEFSGATPHPQRGSLHAHR